jgi:hypothetical protein
MTVLPARTPATPRTAALRNGLWAMAIINLAIGAYGAISPSGFYRNVIGVDLLGPYNEHLLGDIGGFYLGFAAVFAWAAWTLSAELIRGVSIGFAVSQFLHSLFHITSLEGFSAEEAIVQTVALGAILVAPLVFLRLVARDEGALR